jgi:hypothetical protein
VARTRAGLSGIRGHSENHVDGIRVVHSEGYAERESDETEITVLRPLLAQLSQDDVADVVQLLADLLRDSMMCDDPDRHGDEDG